MYMGKTRENLVAIGKSKRVEYYWNADSRTSRRSADLHYTSYFPPRKLAFSISSAFNQLIHISTVDVFHYEIKLLVGAEVRIVKLDYIGMCW